LAQVQRLGGEMVSVETLEGVLERLLADDDTKDVEIRMKDGTVWAHANMLGANSDAIKGMLRHGMEANNPQKKLSWHEHPVEVGRFFLRLLYTGTVSEEEWAEGNECSGSDKCGSLSDREVPLRLLLGSLAIAKVYQVPHLLHALTESLRCRLHDGVFDDICSQAIKLDVTALRLHCLRYAEQPHSRELKEGTRVKALRLITVDCALVHEGVMGTVNSQNRVNWDNRFITRADLVRDMVEIVSVPTSNRVYEMYQQKELSPEVLSELAALWGPVKPAFKRRRKL